MLKNILLITSSILGLILLIKLLLNPERNFKWAEFNRFRIFVLVISFVIISITILIYILGINRGISKKEVVSILNDLTIYKIQSVIICPNSEDESDLLDTINIKNDSVLATFSHVISRRETHLHYTPIPIWKLDIRIRLENRKLDNIRLETIRNRDNRYYFWVIKETSYGDFNLGEYNCDDLGNFLGKFYFKVPK